MMCIKRTTIALTVLGLLIPSSGWAGQSQDRTTIGASEKTVTISGRAGLAGVSMKGLPGDPLTDNTGAYTATVMYGWGGIVTPTKEGFVFEPPNRNYTKVTEEQPNQDYLAKVVTFTISGNAGASGVRMQGLPDSPVTNENGAYAATVPYGWAGRVVPSKEGYSFEPVRKEYPRVGASLRNQDYTARVRMLTISDTIRAGNEPITGVRVAAEPGSATAVTDSQGRYAVQVPYGWTGRLTFSKEGFAFAPDSKSFTNVTSDITGTAPRSPAQPYPRPVVPSAASHVFVIPTAEVVPERFAETAEDMRIMLQILREKLSEPRIVRGAFVDFGDFFGERDRAFEAFYLQGSAAVFVLEMESPFSFASVPSGEGEAPKETADPVWQRARQKVYSPQDPAARGARGLPGETEKMDFQQFREDLLKTLRHAANLRNVGPDESIIVTIIAHGDSEVWPAPAGAGGSYGGSGGAWFEGSSYSTSSSSFGAGGGSTHADSGTRSSGSMAGRGASGRTGTGSAPAAPATVLTIQAKKAGVDAFAKGGLSFEQFQQGVKTFTY